LYFSKDAIKLDKAFKEVETDPKGMIFFIEDNTDDVSAQFCKIKIGKEVINNLKESKQLYNSKSVYNYINNLVTIDDQLFQELIIHGKIESIPLKAVEFLFTAGSLFNPKLTKTILLLLGKICNLVGSFIKKGKLDDYRWNPNAIKLKKDGTEDEDHKFKPFLFPFAEEALEQLDDTKINEYARQSFVALKTGFLKHDTAIRNYIEKTDFGKIGSVSFFLPTIGGGAIPVNAEVDTIPDSAEAFIYSQYILVSNTITNKLNELENFDFTDLIKKGVRVANAFLCGIWNGLLEALSGLFLLFEMVFKGIVAMQDFAKNFSTQFPILMEYVDNILQAIKDINFTELYKTFKSKISQSTQSIETIAYFSGAFIGFLIELTIEIVVGIFITGGALSVAAVLQKLSSIFTGLFKGLANVGKTAFNFGKGLVVKTFNGFKKLLDQLIAFLRKGTKEFKQMINDFFDDVKRIADDVARVVKQEVDKFIKKLPKSVANFINLLPKEMQKRIVNGLLILEFKGKRLASITPKGVFTEINYFRVDIKTYSKITELKNIKLKLTITDDLGKTTTKKYLDNIEVVKTGDNRVGFSAKFEKGKVRDADYINHTFERSGSNPPFKTMPRSKAKVKDSFLKEGKDFYIVENMNQVAPGSFLTNAPIYTIKDLRNKLAVLESWKNNLNKELGELVIRKYKVLQDIPIREGYIGPMKETTEWSKNFGKTYKGGNYQFETLKRFTKEDVFIPSRDGSSLGRIIEQIENFEQILK